MVGPFSLSSHLSLNCEGRWGTTNDFAGEEGELATLVEHLDKASTAHGMEISAKRTKLMTNNTSGINTEIKVNGHKLQVPWLSYN